jgi:hypothetical protein
MLQPYPLIFPSIHHKLLPRAEKPGEYPPSKSPERPEERGGFRHAAVTLPPELADLMVFPFGDCAFRECGEHRKLEHGQPKVMPASRRVLTARRHQAF